jgi:HAD superfamily hydrolase (TIGR01549 family)
MGRQIKDSWKKDFFENIKVVGFDFDDTLVDEKYSLRERWREVLESYSKLHPELIETFLKVFEKKGHKYKYHLNETFNKLSLDEQFIPEMVSKFLNISGEEKLYSKALELIKYLKAKNKLVGIVTNGINSYAKKRIEKSRLTEEIDFVYFGDKYKKPDTTIFRQILKKYALDDPSSFLYIGNHLDEDIISANSIGMKAIWITDSTQSLNTKLAYKVNNLKKLLVDIENNL